MDDDEVRNPIDMLMSDASDESEIYQSSSSSESNKLASQQSSLQESTSQALNLRSNAELDDSSIMPSTSNINDTFTDQSHPLLNMSSHKSLNLSNILFNYDDELEAMLVENLERKQSPRQAMNG